MLQFDNLKSLSINGVEIKDLSINGIQVWKSGYKNWVQYSTEDDGVTIYNGGLGYKNGYRLSSSGSESSSGVSTVTGFIPAKAGDIIRIKGYRWYATVSSIQYLIAYNSENAYEKVFTANSKGAYQTSSFVESMEYSGGISTIKLKADVTGYDCIRISMQSISEDDVVVGNADGANLIVTVNEEIT